MNSNNILDLLDDKKEVSNKEHLDDETIKKIFKKYIQAILIISIVFIIYGFLGKSEVPVANQTLYSRQEITDDMITMKKIPRYKLLKKGLIRYDFDITEKYVAYNKVIKEGSYFYENIITDDVESYDNLEDKLRDGYVLYELPISLDDYEKNKVKLNDKIDIYFEYMDNHIKKIGKLVNDVRIIDVRDKDFLSIFEPSEEERIPKIMYLETSEDDYELLKRFLNFEAYVLKFYYSKSEINTNTNVQELLKKQQYLTKMATVKELTIDSFNSNYIPANFKIEAYIPDKEEVIIRGTESDLNSVGIVKALIDLSKINDWHIGNIKLEDIKLRAYSNTGDIVDVEFVPNTMSVVLVINEKEL